LAGFEDTMDNASASSNGVTIHHMPETDGTEAPMG